jgi:hypothetical protein
VSKKRRDRKRSSNSRPFVGVGFGWRLKRFLGSGGHIVGMLAAIGGILLLDGGLTDGWIGIALVPVLYLTGYFFAARPRIGHSVRPMMARDAPQVRARLDELLSAIRPRVSEDIFWRVVGIRDAIVFTLDHAGQAGEADPDVYLVRQTARAYLPEALSTYLALPREYAEQHHLDNGRTSHDVLLEQLQLMDRNTRKVAEGLIRRNSQQLLAHGRFLTERYSPNSLDVDAVVPAASLPLSEADTRSQRFH